MKRCLKKDWAAMNIKFRQETEAEIQSILLPRYAAVALSFRDIARKPLSENQVLAAEKPAVAEFFEAMGIFDQSGCTISQFYTIWEETNPKSFEENMILRHSFLEIILKLALQKYYSGETWEKESTAIQTFMGIQTPQHS